MSYDVFMDAAFTASRTQKLARLTRAGIAILVTTIRDTVIAARSSGWISAMISIVLSFYVQLMVQDPRIVAPGI